MNSGNSCLRVTPGSFQFMEESLKKRRYVMGSSFTSGFYQMGRESEKRVICHTDEDMCWPNTFPSLFTGIWIGIWWEGSHEDGGAGGTGWGAGGGGSTLNSLFPRAQYDYQSTKMMWFHQVHLLKFTWFRELTRWNLIFGSLRAPLLSQSKAIIHVVQAEVLYNLKQMENFSHCNLETTSPCGPKRSWRLE